MVVVSIVESTNNEKNPYLSVVIPAYNEENRIKDTLIETCATLDSFPISYELIVVNDGSTDGTFVEASKIAEKRNNIKVVHYTQNGGKGNAVRYGCKFVTGNFVTFLDADLELHPKQLKGFFESMKKYDADIVVGSKRHPLSKVNYPYHRKILSWFYHLFVKAIFGLPVNDTQLGLKLFKREVIDSVIPKMLVKRYAYDVELLVIANRLGFSMVEAPIELNFKRNIGRVRLKDIRNIAIDTAAIFYRVYILKYYDENHEKNLSVEFTEKNEVPA
ncbi:MAG: glycosyltransferase [Candidatus Methanoperedens sp.]|nr:glycosyltransferase [Candidatus Methanoperedens sp.]